MFLVLKLAQFSILAQSKFKKTRLYKEIVVAPKSYRAFDLFVKDKLAKHCFLFIIIVKFKCFQCEFRKMSCFGPLKVKQLPQLKKKDNVFTLH